MLSSMKMMWHKSNSGTQGERVKNLYYELGYRKLKVTEERWKRLNEYQQIKGVSNLNDNIYYNSRTIVNESKRSRE